MVQQVVPPVPVTGPVLRNVVPRPRVDGRLSQAAAAARAVLVCAPAGYGKSYAVAAWSQSADGGPVGWANLSQVRDDPKRMWASILRGVAALLPADDEQARRELTDLDSPGVPTDIVATRLAGWTRHWSVSGTLVIDDLHGVSDAHLNAQLLEFLTTAARSVRLVFITRHDPPWPLHQMRLDALVQDVRADTLAFEPDEAEQLLRSSLDVELSEEDLAALAKRTEGWAAGLRMAALGLAAAAEPHAFAQRVSGRDGYIADYLMREVYDGFSPQRRQLLRTVSVVDRVSPGLARALGADEDCADLLHRMAVENALVHEIGQSPGWYRLHPLLLDFVRSRITDARELARQQTRAARWLTEQGHPWAALEHAIAAADWDLAGDLVIRNVLTWAIVRSPTGLIARLEAIPSEAVLATPGLAVGLAGGRVMAGSVDGVADLLDAARVALRHTPRQRSTAYQVVIELIEAGAVRWGGGDLDQMAVAFGGIDVSATRLQDSGLADWAVVRSLVSSNLGACLIWSGRESDALPHLRSAAEAPDPDRLLPALNARSHLAFAHWIRGELQDATEAADAVIADASRLGLASAAQLTCSYLTRAAVALDRDELADADRWLDIVRTAAREPHTVFACELLQARTLAARGHGYEAAKVVRDALAAAPPTLSALLVARGEYFEQALTSRGSSRSALDLGAPVADPGETSSSRWQIYAALRCAIDTRAPYADRITAMTRAADVAAPQLFRRTFLDLQDDVRDLLSESIENGVRDTPFALDLLARMTHRDGHRRNPGVFVPLSERELNILRYLVGSMTTAEIASALYISVNTVKTHQRAVYQKLGVSGRREAVHRARELRLL